MEPFTLKAMAKINLGLDVVKRLSNGYHQVRMVMQTVDLYDELTFEEAEKGICLKIDKAELLADESNLIYKAAKLIDKKYSLPGGVKISCKKNIPMAAGMAGGSTDAAAVFHGLNRLFSLGMTVEEMRTLSVQIGADVPFCITGGTMLCEGIGEILTPLKKAPDCHLVIAKPEVSVSTKYVYEHLHVEKISHHPDMDRVIEAVGRGDLQGMCGSMENILETVTEQKYPVIRQIKTYLKEQGALTALMSGSGPSVFGIFDEKERAKEAYRCLESAGMVKELFLTGFAPDTCVETVEQDNMERTYGE